MSSRYRNACLKTWNHEVGTYCVLRTQKVPKYSYQVAFYENQWRTEPSHKALLSGTVFPDVSTSSWVESSKIHAEMKKRSPAIINPFLFQSSVLAMLPG